MFFKKIVLIMFCGCLLFVPTAFGEDALDGHGWEIWPEEAKLIYLDGFLHGYVAENTHVKIFGYSDTHDDLLTVGTNKFVSEHNSLFYLRELDGFYQSYPLCKKRKFNTVLLDIIKIWDNQGGTRRSGVYKKIGETCAK
ncbi:MAG: hypothetical protein GY721_08450 [Deltaproteobacteria bacterium]|nr:hypothetical protein [Deltaproteobacteria bacterium]